jgi:anti-sigma regulatory factor (Ser/Thr protein kinase)
MVRAEEQWIGLDLPATADRAAQARRAVADLAETLGANRQAVELAVGEAFVNAVLHAYRGRPPGTVSVRAQAERDELDVVVADDGIGMSPNPDSQGLGFGLALMARYADRLEIAAAPGGGTEVRMRFQCFPRSSARTA